MQCIQLITYYLITIYGMQRLILGDFTYGFRIKSVKVLVKYPTLSTVWYQSIYKDY